MTDQQYQQVLTDIKVEAVAYTEKMLQSPTAADFLFVENAMIRAVTIYMRGEIKAEIESRKKLQG